MQEQETMGFTRAVKRCLIEKYADFNGRASRSEYWWFTLPAVLASTLVSVLSDSETAATLFSVAVLLPTWGVGVRRLHDTGRSGWWVLLGFVPLIGQLVLIWWYVTPSEKGTNRFGMQPPETLDAFDLMN